MVCDVVIRTYKMEAPGTDGVLECDLGELSDKNVLTKINEHDGEGEHVNTVAMDNEKYEFVVNTQDIEPSSVSDYTGREVYTIKIGPREAAGGMVRDFGEFVEFCSQLWCFRLPCEFTHAFEYEYDGTFESVVQGTDGVVQRDADDDEEHHIIDTISKQEGTDYIKMIEQCSPFWRYILPFVCGVSFIYAVLIFPMILILAVICFVCFYFCLFKGDKCLLCCVTEWEKKNLDKNKLKFAKKQFIELPSEKESNSFVWIDMNGEEVVSNELDIDNDDMKVDLDITEPVDQMTL